MSEQTVILADGSFPVHPVPLGILRNAERIICCDGGAEALVKAGMEPFAIVGDMDSLNKVLTERYSDRIFPDNDQETNDLTKAVTWCRKAGFSAVTIVGATGKREDHTLGNISLLAEYIKEIKVKLVTDSGWFIPCTGQCRIPASTGQQVSIFSIDPETEITSYGLRYPLMKRKLRNWWQGTLNEATGDYVDLEFINGIVIVFLTF